MYTELDMLSAVVGLLFGIVALAIIAWLIVIGRELVKTGKFDRILSIVFGPAPAKDEVQRSALPVRIAVENILPLIFWILIILPMIVFPIILILFPLLGIPWSYLLPPTP